MDLHRLGEALWKPWGVYLLLGVGILVTLATVLVQLRRLPRAFAGLRGSGPDAPNIGLLLGGSAGMGAISGAAIAITVGGRGALAWMWITMVLGMALHWAEATLSRVEPGDAQSDRPYMARHLGGLGKGLGVVFALGIVMTAIFAGGLFQTHQGGALLGVAMGGSPTVIAIVLAAAAVPFIVVPNLRRVLVGVVVPVAIALYVIVALFIALEDPLMVRFALGDAINGAFGLGSAAGGAAGGAVALALYHGVVRATFAGESGIGAAAVSNDGAGPRPVSAMLVPVITTGLVATLTALVVTTGPQVEEPIADPQLVPLERHESRGLRPSQQVGQTIVLPLDTELQAQKNYEMVVRSNPRGHRFAKLAKEQNAVALPAWKVAENVDTVVFRAREPDLANNPAWDVRVPVNSEVVDVRGQEFLKLTPGDDAIDFGKLIAHYELDPQPYVVFDDYHFVGRVGKATSPDEALGEHLAMYEPRADDAPQNPKLHEFFRGGYRGPYPDVEQERPPWAFVAKQGYLPEPSTAVDLRLRADPRGEAFVRINRVGGAEGPPWRFLLAVDTLVVRNDADPSADIHIPVTPELDGFRIRFKPRDSAWEDFRRIAKMEDHSGPYALVDDFDFEAEVHTDARLSSDLAGRRTLVPLHPRPEPMGPVETVPYDPHPGELIAAGMNGPFLARDGAEIVAARFTQGDDVPWRRWVIVVAGFVLAISTIVAWSEHGGRGAQQLLGQRAGIGVKVLVVGAAGFGGLLTLPQVLGLADAAIAVAAIPNLVAIALCLPQLREALRNQGSPRQPEES